jgi:hypothetical protein
MNNLTLTSHLKHQERILMQEAAGTVVWLELDGGRYYALDSTAGRAWDLCDGHREVSEIARIMGREYDAPAGNIEHDLIELFTELANENLVDAIA